MGAARRPSCFSPRVTKPSAACSSAASVALHGSAAAPPSDSRFRFFFDADAGAAAAAAAAAGGGAALARTRRACGSARAK